MHKPDPREAEPLNRSFNSAHMTQQKNKTDLDTAKKQKIQESEDQTTDTSTASRLATARVGFVDVEKQAAQHAMNSITEARHGKLTSQEQHMEKRRMVV